MELMRAGLRCSLLILILLLQVSLCTFSGRISMSTGEIQATNVVYTFILNFSKQIPAGGKLVVRFPPTLPAFLPRCASISGLTSSLVPCSYMQQTRMLTLTGAFPTTQNQMQFTVSGVTNPFSVQSTASFYIASYDAAQALMETGGSGMTITPTPGSIYSQSLKLKDPTVGLESLLTLTLEQQHQIPSNGQILLTLPKWNQFDPNPANFQSMIAVATSPGQVQCLPVSGLFAPLSCTFTQDSRRDYLQIQLAEPTDVPASTQVQLTIQGVRAPPSQQPVSGFLLRTTDSLGNMLDEVGMPSEIQLQAIYPVQQSQSLASVTAQPPSVRSVSTVTLTVQNMNPLLPRCSLLITVPSDFDMSFGVITASAIGDSLNPAPTVTVSVESRTIMIQDFNLAYLNSFSFSYFYIAGMQNPGQSGTTGSFALRFYDPQMTEIEYIDQGVTFEAQINDFVSQKLTVLNPAIAQQNVGYRFVIEPRDSFTSAAVVKLTFPSELWVKQTATLEDVSANMRISAKISVQYNHVVTLANAFPFGYTAEDKIQFTLKGVTNPETTAKTGGITIKIYYQEYTNEINAYTGDGLTFQARASNQLTVGVALSAQETGQTNDNFTIWGTTPLTMPIAKGAYVRVTIPAQFTITDAERVAATCRTNLGFSDELVCNFESVDRRRGAVLIAQNGFQSKTFPGGTFSFSLSAILSPFTTETTDAFAMEIYDSKHQLLYKPEKDTTTAYVRASNFSFAFVESQSAVNGVSSLYNFSITLSVDTPVGTTLSVALPDQIYFDESKSFTCKGTMGFTNDMQCFKRNGRVIWITLLPTNTFESVVGNGTTLEFQLGWLINPVSLQPSDTFRLQTFKQPYGAITSYNYINQAVQGLRISNTERGTIMIKNISQVGSRQLSTETMILFELTTANPIPAGSIATLIMPTNIGMSGGKLKVRVNQQLVSGAFMSNQTHTITVPISDDLKTEFRIAIVGGLFNPSQAPYEYSSFVIEFQTSKNWGIDYVRTDQPWIQVECNDQCDFCAGTLDNCLMCGPDTATGETYFLAGTECVQTCPPGFYGGFGYVCLPCQAPCTDCMYAADLCTKCDPSSDSPYSNQATLSCTDSCPSGTYLNAEIMECMDCQAPCYTCSSATTCLTCDSSDPSNSFVFFYEPEATCLETCPVTTLPSPSNVCIDCESPCVTCTEIPDKCTACVEGKYLYKNLCVDRCPFQFYTDETTWTCQSVATLDIPMPFSITMIVVTVGVGIMSCMRHSGQGSTAFWVTNLAICDILLRVNWFIMGVLALSLNYIYTFFGCCCLLFVGLMINLLLWRRFFKYKYNMDENDRAFLTYCQNYPRTSHWILFMSYLITFQAIRLSYSRILGKKMFMASFTRQKRYYRLIGQLSIIEVLFMYCPAALLMVYSIGFEFVRGQQLFYIGVDSLFLVTYAIVFIIVTLTQREKVMEPRELFKWTEICRCWVDQDDEDIYDVDSDEPVAPGSRKKKRSRVQPIMAGLQEDDAPTGKQKLSSANAQELETMSATDLDQLQLRKLYKTEMRSLPDRHNPVTAKSSDTGLASAEDYSQLKRLEEKLSRVQLKTKLYEHKRATDHTQVQELGEQMHLVSEDHSQLKAEILQLQSQLADLKREIAREASERDAAVSEVIQRRKDEIAMRSASPQRQPHQFTLNSIRVDSQESNQFFSRFSD